MWGKWYYNKNSGQDLKKDTLRRIADCADAQIKLSEAYAYVTPITCVNGHGKLKTLV